MGKVTGISWCDHTFNGWRGCTKVSAGCAHCYAERDSKRNPGVLGVWGPSGTRVCAAPSYWKQPLKWDREAEEADVRRRVFTASLADVFEQWDGEILSHVGYPLCVGGWAMTMDDLRLRLFDTIRLTPHLTWLVLTKRPEAIVPTIRRIQELSLSDEPMRSWLAAWFNGKPPKNVWLGTSVEDQATADERIPHLLKIPAAVRWISYEPALGPVDFDKWMPQLNPDTPSPEACCPDCGGDVACEDNGYRCVHHGGIYLGCGWEGEEPDARPLLDWIIVGGESGSQARPFALAWAHSTIEQCKTAGVACFVKQLGARPGWWRNCGLAPGSIPSAAIDRHLAMGGSEPDDVWHEIELKHPAGADPAEWDEPLRVREHPRAIDR